MTKGADTCSKAFQNQLARSDFDGLILKFQTI